MKGTQSDLREKVKVPGDWAEPCRSAGGVAVSVGETKGNRRQRRLSLHARNLPQPRRTMEQAGTKPRQEQKEAGRSIRQGREDNPRVINRSIFGVERDPPNIAAVKDVCTELNQEKSQERGQGNGRGWGWWPGCRHCIDMWG